MATEDPTLRRPARGDTIPGAYLSDNRPGPRYLIDYTAPDTQWFEVRANGVRLRTFYTGGVNGRSAIDTAIGNVMDESETGVELELFTGGVAGLPQRLHPAGPSTRRPLHPRRRLTTPRERNRSSWPPPTTG
jgi:hypothetical protein